VLRCTISKPGKVLKRFLVWLRHYSTIYRSEMQTLLPLSVAVITLNEEQRLKQCLESVRELAAEMVVIDSGSTDRTEEIARTCGAKFVVEPWAGHVAQKNKALQHASREWVLCLDADESLSPELAESIRQALSQKTVLANGFSVNRRSFYLGDWVRHAWYPEWRLRLVRRGCAQWVGRDPHDRLEANGFVERLEGDLYHYSYANLQDHLERTVRYARIASDALSKEGFQLRWYHLVFSPWAAFLKRLVVKSGWRDGWRGWIIAFTAMLSVFGKYAFLLEKRWSESCRRK
jgi:glycosyltransferase involved in cell wall biosynthesis